jgi:hypothetical protein
MVKLSDWIWWHIYGDDNEVKILWCKEDDIWCLVFGVKIVTIVKKVIVCDWSFIEIVLG